MKNLTPINEITYANLSTSNIFLPLGSISAAKDITSIVDGTSDTILITCASHGYIVGDTVIISNTTDYDYSATVIWKDTNTFKVQIAYVSNKTSGNVQKVSRVSTSNSNYDTNLCGNIIIIGANDANTITVSVGYASTAAATTFSLITQQFTATVVSTGMQSVNISNSFLSDVNNLSSTYKHLIGIKSSGSDIGVSVAYSLFDNSRSIDVGTINGLTPMTETTIAQAILENPSYPIVTNPDGSVKTKNGLAR